MKNQSTHGVVFINIILLLSLIGGMSLVFIERLMLQHVTLLHWQKYWEEDRECLVALNAISLQLHQDLGESNRIIVDGVWHVYAENSAIKYMVVQDASISKFTTNDSIKILGKYFLIKVARSALMDCTAITYKAYMFIPNKET